MGSVKALIGHRGTGKTTFLKRLSLDCKTPDVRFFDLDTEIESFTGKQIFEIFSEQGESEFRALEKKIFEKLLSENKHLDIVISLGAGFEFTLAPDIEPIFVRRNSDADGRIFFNRPRLTDFADPLAEYLEKFKDREKKFLKIAVEGLTLPEGRLRIGTVERAIVMGDKLDASGFSVTLPPIEDLDPSLVRNWVEKRLRWNYTFFEFRDDLLNEEEVEFFIKLIPTRKRLFSRRSIDRNFQGTESCALDWALELGSVPDGLNVQIISLHAGPVTPNLWSQVNPSSLYHLKWSPVVSSFEELEVGHDWWQEDSENRSFLPRSPTGRWKWYRQLFGSRMKINFIADHRASAPDQPSLIESYETPKNWENFAAVLGDPVAGSYSPERHKDLFGSSEKFKTPMPFVSIEVGRSDNFSGVMDGLSRLGLRAAAVTSPLKLETYRWAMESSKQASEFKSVNTLICGKGDEWWGENTDIEGAKKLLLEFRDKEVIVWGGGGVLPIVKKILPHAKFISAREGTVEKYWKPEVLVWAAGLNMNTSIQLPPKDWSPKIVVDISYQLNSFARSVALKYGAKYVSGDQWFDVQAARQQELWLKAEIGN